MMKKTITLIVMLFSISALFITSCDNNSKSIDNTEIISIEKDTARKEESTHSVEIDTSAYEYV